MFFKNSLQTLLALSSVACLVVFGNPEFGVGQTSTATLTGIVQDQTGAVLPNVTITVTNTDRNTSQLTRTNETGSYVLPALNPPSIEALQEFRIQTNAYSAEFGAAPGPL